MPRKPNAEDDEQVEQADSTEEAPTEREAAPSLDDLVKMKKDGRFIHAHPTVVAEHKKNGWELA
jgi:hypothetical protein